MAYVLTEGHVRRGIDLQRLTGPLCTNAAVFYGFSETAATHAGMAGVPSDGSVADGPVVGGVGGGPDNPDRVVWSFAEPYRYSRSLGGGAGDHSLYEGMEFIAMPEEVHAAGKLRSRMWQLTTEEGI